MRHRKLHQFKKGCPSLNDPMRRFTELSCAPSLKRTLNKPCSVSVQDARQLGVTLMKTISHPGPYECEVHHVLHNFDSNSRGDAHSTDGSVVEFGGGMNFAGGIAEHR